MKKKSTEKLIERQAKELEFKDNDNFGLICEDCGEIEGPPFDEGDEYICGGKFRFLKNLGKTNDLLKK